MRIIVGVTGATGVEMSYYLVKALKCEAGCQVDLIVSDGARNTWELESRIPFEEFLKLADVVHSVNDLAVDISSGSCVTDGMVIMPCTMKTLAGIASGYAENLILRTADVCLKEGRKVVLVPREMPLGKVHIRNLKEASDLGCTIVPPMLTFYHHPETIEDMIWHVVGKVLLQFGIACGHFMPWKGENNDG